MAAAMTATPTSIKKRFIFPPVDPPPHAENVWTQHRRRGHVNSRRRPGRERLLAPGDSRLLTRPHRRTRIVFTADYFVIPAPVPCSVAVFTCRCGAQTVEYDLERAAPPDWSSAEDGSTLCPRCSAAAAGRGDYEAGIPTGQATPVPPRPQ